MAEQPPKFVPVATRPERGTSPLVFGLEAALAQMAEASQQAEQEYRALLHRGFDPMVLIRQRTGLLLEANDTALQVFGLDRAHLSETGVYAIADGRLTPLVFGKETSLAFAHEDIEYEAAAAELQFKGEPAVMVICRDVTEKRRVEQALRLSEERFVLAARGANDGLWDWDLVANRIYFSPRWKTMLGMDEDQLANSPNEWFIRVHADDLERIRAAIDAHLAGETPHFESEHRILHRDGTYRWVLTRGLAVVDQHGHAYRMAGSMTEITGQRKTEEELLRRAFYDSLTELPNRSLFLERLWRAVDGAKRRRGYLFAVLFIDLDRFKVVNDTLGHIAGDLLLEQIAKRLKGCVRPSDTLARLGGDEFAVIVEFMMSPIDATRVADRIHGELTAPFDIRGQQIFTSASIGIALSTTGYDTPEDLLREADLAMYRAKAAGRARYVVFDAEIHAAAMTQMRLETDLRSGLENGQFFVHYQPVVSLATGKVISFEALARWRHPERGLVPPSEFIPVAEETGAISAIDELVMREACREAATWRGNSLSAPKVSVNLSSRQFCRPDLITRIDVILAETGLDSTRLEIELTESALIENAEAAAKTLHELRSRGIELLLDDFGTGYSSLSYLHQFRFDTLKIDQSFVSGLELKGRHLEIVSAIVALAHNLGLKVIAEGVEREEARALLHELSCDSGQGYLFSEPVDALSVRALLANEDQDSSETPTPSK